MKKLFVVAVLAISIILCVVIWWGKPLYGNDEASIVEVIRSIEGYEAESAIIEILDITDSRENRIVSLIFNQNPAYMRLTKNVKGNYQWSHFEVRRDESLSQFTIHMLDEDDAPPTILYVANENNKIAQIRMTVNGEVVESDIRPYVKDVVWVELPKTKEKSYQFYYTYFDEGGNQIE
ncbi:hypothetical protein [Sporosarcina sp. FSL K6-3457]|uniref:hypothetical protein n=1 Tax=Sporosarcina sp. FSL K6-3457 TaxID=2978204 RepID=UPI0030F66160